MNKSRHRVSRPLAGMHAAAIAALVALFAGLLPVGTWRAAAQVAPDGEYTLQCSCPVEWWEPWEGEGAFDDDESLDEVVLENGDSTLIMHEIPLEGSTILDLVDMRTEELEGSRRIEDLAEVVRIDGNNTAIIGRTWMDRNHHLILSYQYVQIWESDFLLSIEFIAPDDQFVDLWDSLVDVELVGTPVLDEFVGETVHESLTEGTASPSGTATAVPVDEQGEVDLEAIGVIDDGLYQSPAYGYEVEWTGDWVVKTDTSGPEAGFDTVQFITEDGWMLAVSGEELDSRDTIEDYLDSVLAFEEEEYGSEILLDDVDDEVAGYLAVYTAEPGDELVVYSVISLVDEDAGVVVNVQLIAPTDQFEDALADAQDSFLLEGAPVLDFFRSRQIQRALE